MTERWRQQLAHEGHVRIRLRLLAPGEGGRDRALQTGFKAEWVLPGADGPTLAPIDLVGGRPSLRPGDEGIVVAHPFEPECWHDLAPGTPVDLWWSPGRRLGRGVVEAVVDVPDHPVPVRWEEPGPNAAALTRRGRPHPVRRLRRAG